MAKGNKDLELVTELLTLDAFNDFLKTNNGLVVCETFQDWAGPCVVMKRFLKKAKFELLEGEEWDLIHYSSIKVELVPTFVNLRGRCVPTYLFFGGRQLVHIFRGHEPSFLMPLIREMVKREKLCMSGKVKRTVFSDVMPYIFPATDPPIPDLPKPEPEPLAVIEPEPMAVAVAPPPAPVTVQLQPPKTVSSKTSQVLMSPTTSPEAKGFPDSIADTGQHEKNKDHVAARSAVGLHPVDSKTDLAVPLITAADQSEGKDGASAVVSGITEMDPDAANIVHDLILAPATLPTDPHNPGGQSEIPLSGDDIAGADAQSNNLDGKVEELVADDGQAEEELYDTEDTVL